MSKVSKVAWEGSSDVKTLVIQWADISLDGYCDNKPTATADCTDKTCNFDFSKLPAKTDELYCLCYGATATAKDGTTSVADPRLIIRR